MYAGLLSVNVTLFLRIVAKLMPNTLCDILLGLDVHFKYFFIACKYYLDSFS